MYFLLNLKIFQPAILVYQRVTLSKVWVSKLGNFWNFLSLHLELWGELFDVIEMACHVLLHEKIKGPFWMKRMFMLIERESKHPKYVEYEAMYGF